MTTVFELAQAWVLFGLGVAAFVAQVVALVDAIRRPGEIFPAAGKMTKGRWITILTIASAFGFVSLAQDPVGFLNIIGFVAAAVYLVDVRPAIRKLMGGPQDRPGSFGSW
jgi:hypothetical protein